MKKHFSIYAFLLIIFIYPMFAFSGGAGGGGGLGKANRIQLAISETRFELARTPERHLILLPDSYPEEALKEITTPPELLQVNDPEFNSLADKETAVGRYILVYDYYGNGRVFFINPSQVPGAVELIEYFPTDEEWQIIYSEQ